MADIDISVNFDQAIDQADKLTDAIDAIGNELGEVTQVVNKFNKEGDLAGVIIRGLTKDGKDYVTTLRAVTEAEAKRSNGAKAAGQIEVGNVKYINNLLKERQRLAKEAEEAQKAANAGVQAFQDGLARVGRNLQQFVTYKAFNFITNQLEDGVRAANQLQIKLSLIRTITQDKQIGFKDLGKSVRRVSDSTGFDINDTAQAFYDATSNQIARGKDTEAFVKTAAEFARVTGSTLPDAVNLLSTAINTYNKDASDATAISAALFKTIDEGRVVAAELNPTLGRALVTAKQLGIAQEDIFSTIALTTQKGIPTANSVTLLTNFLQKLEKPTVETSRLLKQLGVDSAEAAIKIYGTTGLIRRFINEVDQGNADAKGLFDELRGGQQFDVFRAAIDQVDTFSQKLKDTQNLVRNFEAAKQIRGESSADQLNLETNRVRNAFTENFGQSILKNSNALVQYGKSAGEAVLKNETLGATVNFLVPAVGIYTTALVGVRAATYAWGLSNTATAATLSRLALTAGPVIIALASTAYIAREIAETTKFDNFKEVDLGKIDNLIDRLERIKKLQAEQSYQPQQKQTFNDLLGATAGASYRGLTGIIAQAKIQNDRLLDSAKLKSKQTGDELKLAFAGYSDTLRDKMTQTRDAIARAREEVERSKKSVTSFRDTLNDTIFNRQYEYGNDFQKIELANRRMAELVQQGKDAFAKGGPEDTAEARRLFNEAARVADQKNDLIQQLRRKDAEASGQGSYLYSTENLQRDLGGIKGAFEEAELSLQRRKNKEVKNGNELLLQQEDRYRRLQDALRKYEDTSIYDEKGGLKKGVLDGNGKFNQRGFEASLSDQESNLRAFAGKDEKLRKEVEDRIAAYRRARINEGQAAERQEFLKTLQTQLSTQEEKINKGLQDQKKRREDAIKDQSNSQLEILSSANALQGFGKGVENQFGFAQKNFQYDKVKPEFDKLNQLVANYEGSIQRLRTGAANVNGVRVFRPEDIERTEKALEAVTNQVKALQDLSGNPNQQPAIVSNGKTLSYNDFLEVTKDQLKQARGAGDTIRDSFSKEGDLGKELEEKARLPLQQLKSQFPELDAAAQAATLSLESQFKRVADKGLQPLFDRLADLRAELGGLGLGNIGQLPQQQAGPPVLPVIGPPEFRAAGGMIGFPGSPRGVDRYPVWAARGEYIVNAASTRMFRPMLDAINNRRPSYMAAGGIVGGGDTNIGDISVTVNGASTNAGTGQAVVKAVERAARRGLLRRK